MSNFDSVMLDLETMGNGSNSAIVSIGAVWFNQYDLDTYESITPDRKFYIRVNLNSCLDRGLEVTGSTIIWWLQQSEEARRELTESPGAVLEKALLKLQLKFDNRQMLWGNGATFDNVIIRNAFKACGLEFPLPFYQDMCYRTIKKLRPEIKLHRCGTHHNALDDAISQALHLQRVSRALAKPAAPQGGGGAE